MTNFFFFTENHRHLPIASVNDPCKNLFWSIKNSGEILNKLKSRGFLASGLSTYDFSTLYTTLPHNLIKEKLTELIEHHLTERAHFIWLVMIKMPFYF